MEAVTIRTHGALLLLLLLLVGCQGGGARNPSRGGLVANDPLLGGGSPLPAGQATARGTDRAPYAATVGRDLGQPARPAGPLPSLPSPSGSTSPAALASGATGTLDAAPALRIGSGTNTPPDADWRGPGEAPRHSYQSAPTGPVPPPGSDTTPAVTLPPLTLTSYQGNDQSLDQLLRQVEARGAVQPRLDKKDGEWIFSCRIPNRENPSLLHCYEVAADSNVAAVQAVLDQIRQDRR